MNLTKQQPELELIYKVNEAKHYDPFMVLGNHLQDGRRIIRTLLPFAETVYLHCPEQGLHEPMQRIPYTDIFVIEAVGTQIPDHYRIEWTDKAGNTRTQTDPYSFLPVITDYDLHLFCEGNHHHAYHFLGAGHRVIDGISGILFAVWAPNARRVSVVGDFNRWNGRCHPMRVRGSSGVWELFIPELEGSHNYKYEIHAGGGGVFLKADPYARQYELRPSTASVIPAEEDFAWQDEPWLRRRAQRDWLHSPMSVYEVHLGSWRKAEHNNYLNYRELAHQLVAYVKEAGFNYIELLPITEHPFDASWGYQTTGYFAPTRRFGDVNDFKYFVDYCHRHEIGVILDWAPGHFPKDDHALSNFDGTPLYEHADPKRGEHRDWGTLIFNYGRHEVKSFLISSAVFWLSEMHLDGLRVDAVASMLYLDYSRDEGDWIPNIYGGNENLEAIDFLKTLNRATHSEAPGSLMIAEESTAWPQVTRPDWLGGLGFSMKWNMGWMHDTLKYMQLDPVHRHYHHNNLTFGLLYAFTENFVLPFSHDEVVHGKGSMINKMPGDEWQQFANLRLLYTYMYTYPGKKLLFMGSEFAQRQEWQHHLVLDWHLLQYAFHHGVKDLVRDLNRLYLECRPLHYDDFVEAGFEWIDCNDASQSVLSYLRKDDNGQFVVVILNFTPVPRENYRIGLPAGGPYREIHNSDSTYYGGSNLGNGEGLNAEDISWMGRPFSLSLTLPPLAGIILQPAG